MSRFFCLWGFVVLLGLGCEPPPGAFEPDNPNDPNAPGFQPQPPTELLLTYTPGRAVLTWRDQSQHEDGYLVEQAVDSSDTFVVLAHLEPNVTRFETAVPRRVFSVTYRVSAFNHEGDSLHRRHPLTATTAVAGATGAEFEILDELTARVTWQDTTDFEEGFRIYRATLGERLLVGTVGPDETEWVGQPPRPMSQQHFYEVAPFNAGASGLATATSWKQLTLSVPSWSSLAGTNPERVELAWEQEHTKIRGIWVERRRADEQDFVKLAQVAPGERQYTDTSVDPAYTYAYRLRTLTSQPGDVQQVNYRESIVRRHRLLTTDVWDILDTAFDPEAREIVMVDKQGRARFWDLDSGTLKRTVSYRFPVDGDPRVIFAELSPGGRYVAAQFVHGDAYIYDLVEARVLHSWHATSGAAAFSDGGQTAAFYLKQVSETEFSCRLLLWEAVRPEEEIVLQQAERQAWCNAEQPLLSFDPAGEFVAFRYVWLHEGANVWMWEIEGARKVFEGPLAGNGHRLLISPGGRYLFFENRLLDTQQGSVTTRAWGAPIYFASPTALVYFQYLTFFTRDVITETLERSLRAEPMSGSDWFRFEASVFSLEKDGIIVAVDNSNRFVDVWERKWKWGRP